MEDLRPRILIGDDNPMTLKVLQMILKEDYLIRTAKSGTETIKIVADFEPDLILLATALPELNGYEVCKKLQTDRRSRDIPVIFITSGDEIKNDAQWLAAGVVDYITEPFNPQIIRLRLQAHLELKRHRTAADNMALIDPTTGVASRDRFEIAIDKEWRRAARGKYPLSLILADFDHFKKFKEFYGGPVADNCLKMVATKMNNLVQRAGDLVVRYGEDEFVVILPMTEVENGLMVAEKIRAAIESLRIQHQQSSFGVVTISAGVSAVLPEPHQEIAPGLLVDQAQKALTRAKEKGRNQVSK